MRRCLQVVEDCSMYMSARQVPLERLKTKSKVDLYVRLNFYQLWITFASILGSILDPKAIQNSFQSGLG